MEEKIDVLKNTLLFSGWQQDELLEIINYFKTVNYKKDDIIFKAGNKADRFYVILQGNAVILSAESNSVVAEFVSGDMFGETAFLTANVQNGTAVAGEDSCFLEFPANGQPLNETLSDNPKSYARLLKSFLVSISKRTREANSLVKENSPIMRELRKQVYGDKLTGLFNRTYLEENIKNFVSNGFSLIMMKPDNFKEINDNFGHEVGDSVLVFIGKHLAHFLTGNHITIRYQGNEFAVLTAKQNRDEAISLASKIKDELENLDISSFCKGISLTVSLGIVICPEDGTVGEKLIEICAGLPLEGRLRGGSKILFAEDIK